MRDPAFDLVWQKVAQLEGAAFATSAGSSFTYSFHKTYIVVSSGKQSVPKTFFEKIFHRLQNGLVESSPALQGQSFILAILADARVRDAAVDAGGGASGGRAPAPGTVPRPA
ncbi:MAG TPA: hypothetical protein VEU62_16155 [Bryobacterales bacterium]|nr:hypothetical protein [Bryobacterales bacterium]